MFRNLQALRQISQRTISSSSRRALHNKVPEHQKLFQEDDGLPVHLKAGVKDALLYRMSMLLTIFGSCYALSDIFKASFPKNQD